MRRFLKPVPLILLMLLLSSLLVQFAAHPARTFAAPPSGELSSLPNPQVSITPTDITPTVTMTPETPTLTATPTETITPTLTATPTVTPIPDPCPAVMNSLYLTDQFGYPPDPANRFRVGLDVYLRGLLVDSFYTLSYSVTDQSGREINSGRIGPSETGEPFSELLVQMPPVGQYMASVTLEESDLQGSGEAPAVALQLCTRNIVFLVGSPVTITPTATSTPTLTPTAKPKEPEPEPKTKIVSIQLQVANGKIWGLMVVEQPRAGRSVTLRLEYRVPAARLQQEPNDGFSPTGQTTTIGLADDQTNYNFSFERPAGLPDNTEYRVAVEDSSGNVSGTDATSLPVSFERPLPGPTVTPQPQSPAPSESPRPAPATPTSPILGNVNPSPSPQSVAGGAVADEESRPRELLPQTASGRQFMMLGLVLIAIIFFAAAFILLQVERRVPRE